MKKDAIQMLQFFGLSTTESLGIGLAAPDTASGKVLGLGTYLFLVGCQALHLHAHDLRERGESE